ncbi:MAG: hypothetical protein ACJ8LL_00990 [Candidatus Udaeobacter sp.]
MNQKWFLRKHEDGSTFGPVQFDQITRWAAAAQIAPHDTLSNDGQTWVRAPMVPQLSMDWLVELTTENYYGPTTLGTLREFIRVGEIDAETVVINSCDGTRRQVQEMPDLWETAPSEADENQFQIELGDPVAPALAKMSGRLQERIRDLEQALQEERRALAESQQRYDELERKYQELLLRDLS